MNRRSFAPIFALVLTLSSVRAEAAFLQVDTLWKKKELKVCFAESRADLSHTEVPLSTFINPDVPGGLDTEELSQLKIVPVPSELKAQIQKAVEDSFSSGTTGISFSGWTQCRSPHDIAIFYVMDDLDRDPARGRTFSAGSIGRSLNFSKTSIRLNHSKAQGYHGDFIMPSLKTFGDRVYGAGKSAEALWESFGQYELLRAVVHEFGHLAGLRHEQERFSVEDFKKGDISFHRQTSQDLLDARDEELIWTQIIGSSGPRAKKIGLPNPNSTMHYFFTDYDEHAEKYRLACELANREKGNWEVEYFLGGLYGFLTHQERKQLVEKQIPYHAELKREFCGKSLLLNLTPKSRFERGALLDTQSQAALRSVYSGVRFIDPVSEDEPVQQLIRSTWGAMTDFYW